MILPITKSGYRILCMIYANRKTKISDLWRKTSVSSRVLYKFLAQMKKSKMIREEKIGAKIRMISPDLESEGGRLIFSLIEMEKRLRFFDRHPELSGAFGHLARALGGAGGVKAVAIFGSYSREAETADSDLDVVFITTSLRPSAGTKKRIETICETCFVSLPVRVSSRIAGSAEFRAAVGKDSMVDGIIKDHVCVFNCMGWIEAIA